MKSLKSSLFLAFVLCAALAAVGCGSSSKQIKELNNITVDLPSGWTVSTSDYGKGTVAEINAKGFGRVLQISEAKNKAASFDELARAMSKDMSVVEQETAPNGFGGTFQKKSSGTKYPVYMVNLGDKAYFCEAGPYYDEKALADTIKVCKSIH